MIQWNMIENGSIIYEDSNLDFWTFDILGLVVIVDNLGEVNYF